MAACCACCAALGADMYDSVYPTRTARFGVALVPEGMLKLKNAVYSKDYRWGEQRGRAGECGRVAARGGWVLISDGGGAGGARRVVNGPLAVLSLGCSSTLNASLLSLPW